MSRLSRLRERVAPAASVVGFWSRRRSYSRRFSSDVTAGLSRTSGSRSAVPSRARPTKMGAASRVAPQDEQQAAASPAAGQPHEGCADAEGTADGREQ
jgi:hypothetical protein